MSDLEINEDNCVLSETELQSINVAFKNMYECMPGIIKREAKPHWNKLLQKITKLNDKEKNHETKKT